MPTDDEKWEAVRQSDPGYDGVFFYGITTTGIFCRPSCRSRLPLRNNVQFFDSIEQAYAWGLRPCKRCRPDLPEYRPNRDLMEKAKTIFDTCFANRRRLAGELKQLGISQNHLINLFRRQYHQTPVEYLNKLRVNKAAGLLAGSRDNIVQIALACGFGSLSTFYYFFKRQIGMTPHEYRKTKRKGDVK